MAPFCRAALRLRTSPTMSVTSLPPTSVSSLSSTTAEAHEPGLAARLWQRAKRLDRIFLLTVALPTLGGALYYGLIASDVYISESRFVVRSPERNTPAASGISALLAGTGFSRATDDTYSVHDYVLSRDATSELERSMKLRSLYSRDAIDIFSRFAPFGWDSSMEQFNVYYQTKVDIDFDTSTSISTLTVRAYSAKDSHDINERLISMSEQLLNSMNERSRHDLVDEADRQAQIARKQDLDVTAALAAYRASGSIIDPVTESGIALTRIGRLRDDLLAAEKQLDQLRRVSPSNPQIAELSANIDMQRRSIASESASLTGGGSASLNTRSGPLGRLMLEKDFADRTLQQALADLDNARSEAQRKHLYLERLVQPNLPDRAMEPRRIRSIATVFALGLVAWGVVSLITASVREHVD